MNINYRLPLLSVKNVDISKNFYKDLFNQDVSMDLGKNVTFSSGFAIQEDFAWLTDIDANSVIQKSNNMELYFEVDDFDAFINKLSNYSDIQYVHKPKKHEWQQRVVRIYDPDFHIIEIGESMEVIAKRYLSQGFSTEKVAEIIQHPIEFVEKCALSE